MTPPRIYTADKALREIEAEASDQLSEIESLDTVDLHVIPATDELRRAVRLVTCLRRLMVGRTPDEVYKAFGAPGDWGYEIPLGQALQQIYRTPATAPDHAARADAAEKRVADLGAALRTHGTPCCYGECRALALWISPNGITYCDACREKRSAARNGDNSDLEPIAHADALRSLDAPPALVPCDDVVAELEGTTTEPRS